MPVAVPQKQPGMTGQLLPAAAGAAGQAYGPAAGMAASAAARGLTSGGAQGAASVQSDAIQRRIDAQSQLMQQHQDIAAAQDALGQMSPDQQQQYAPILNAAQAKLQGGQR